MTDIVERLRKLYVDNGTNYVQEAADTIETLRQQIEQLLQLEKVDKELWECEGF